MMFIGQRIINQNQRSELNIPHWPELNPHGPELNYYNPFANINQWNSNESNDSLPSANKLYRMKGIYPAPYEIQSTYYSVRQNQE